MPARSPLSRRAASRLLALAGRHQRGDVGVGVPRALRAVGENEMVHTASGRRPLRQRGPAAELDVVGVGADGERRRRDGKVAADYWREWGRVDPVHLQPCGKHLLHQRVRQVFGCVDVAGQQRVAAHDDALAAGDGLREVSVETNQRRS